MGDYSADPQALNARWTLAKWIIRLEMRHWEITFVLDEALELEVDSGVPEALVVVDPNYSRAVIKLNPDTWRQWDQGLMERNIVHELVHCHLEALWMSAMTVEECMGKEAWDGFHGRMLHELERAVDGIAHALVTQWDVS